MAKKLHSFRCTDDLWDAISSRADAVNLSANEVMEQILRKDLGLSDDVTSGSIADPIADLSKRVSALEKAIAGSDIESIAPAIAKPIAADTSGWMTTGEARTAMQQRHGYKASPGTFRRHLRAAQEQQRITSELKEGGVIELDFETRAAANPKSNSVRWIRVS